MANDVGIEFSGAFFDAGGEIVEEAVVAARHAVAERGAEIVKSNFEDSIVVNNERFTSKFTLTDESRTYSSSPGGRKAYTMSVDVPPNTTTVTSSEAAYGPWLEGTGSRNPQTRFKGYFGFRDAAIALDAEAVEVAEQAIAPYVERLNS